MKVITSEVDRVKLVEAEKKAKRLCTLYKCGLVDLMILSIDAQAELKKAQNKN